MHIAVIGTGYVGLVTGACFAEVGHEVVCVDNDAAKVKMLQAGGIPIYEPGVEELVKKNVAAQRLRFTGDIADGVKHSEVMFIAVPTHRGVHTCRGHTKRWKNQHRPAGEWSRM